MACSTASAEPPRERARNRPADEHERDGRRNRIGDLHSAARYHVASPKELLEAAQEMGVEFIPCQMTMDMFGLTRDDLIDGMGEPVGAATVIGLMSEGSSPLFI